MATGAFSRRGFLSAGVKPIKIVKVSLSDEIDSPGLTPTKRKESKISWDDAIYVPLPVPTWDPDDAFAEQCDEALGALNAEDFRAFEGSEGVETAVEVKETQVRTQTNLRHVAFARSRAQSVRVSEYSVQPYAEVYGMHPRHFDFDADGNMLPKNESPRIAAARVEVYHGCEVSPQRQLSMGFLRHDEFEYDNIF